MTEDELSEKTIKKAQNLITDSRLAVLAGLMPILGLIFILRLVQWYLWKNQNPAIVSLSSEHAQLSRDFRSALPRLWFAVLFWPVLILGLILYGFLT